ncbi:efflux RND transporter periplasmic adaptor subunit [Azovibrio restrictus]|uniref:efflux RND transporter periplasmic adaptor subunit n=1 Tax=Azovibrio restrictus TaxID=146938 RepID=UPI0026ED29D0|nr:efflux RND transporter periplasmic adaptor subunit [Azovibrio restrictus]MDD3484550.1 efflux RND transporter periplasmic adaptor subunit [Azovibrio restrictus]
MATSSKRVWISALAVAGLVGLGFLAYSLQRAPAGPQAITAGNGAPASPAAPAGSAAGAVAVEVTRVSAASFADETTAVGTLKSNESVVLRPETSGRIAAIHFKDGQVVRRGALLLSLDAGIQEAELQQARANLALAQANQQRNEDLFQKKFISQQSLDNTKAALKVQEASVALAEARLAKTRIRAPFDGVVGIRNVSVGDYVKEGEELVNVEDIATLKVDFRLPEAYLGRLERGQTLEVSSDALPGVPFQATLEAVDPLVDVNGRSISCRALLPNREGRLRPGMFVRSRLVFGERKDALMLPEQAVVTGARPRVFRVEEGKARAVTVQLGVRRDGRVEILEGLALGDTIITAGQLKVRDGMAVRPVGDTQEGMSGMQAVSQQ